jgi:hypothetical protein
MSWAEENIKGDICGCFSWSHIRVIEAWFLDHFSQSGMRATDPKNGNQFAWSDPSKVAA